MKLDFNVQIQTGHMLVDTVQPLSILPVEIAGLYVISIRSTKIEKRQENRMNEKSAVTQMEHIA